MLLVAIIDYGSGNLRSVAKAFEQAGGDRAHIEVTNDPATLKNATHIVLPGVGAFADCMRGLEAEAGMREALEREVRQNKKPFLGVCVGMQMLFEAGHEHGIHKGLGWLKGEVVKIGTGYGGASATTPLEGKLADAGRGDSSPLFKLKIPHMGWNDLTLTQPSHPLLSGIKNGDHAYFVHSYHAACAAQSVIATTDYGGPVTAAVAQGNIMGTQFHPEKSQETGLTLIANFLGM